jgi:penicillin-binding protein 1A
MLRLLETVIRNGTGSSARLPVRAYGKTGTTQNHRDALFVGFAGDLVVGVWVGNDDNTPMRGVSGRGLPAQIWREFMRAALERDGAVRAPEPVDIAALEAAAATALEVEEAAVSGPPLPPAALPPDGSTPERAIPVDPGELPPGAEPA